MKMRIALRNSLVGDRFRVGRRRGRDCLCSGDLGFFRVRVERHIGTCLLLWSFDRFLASFENSFECSN